MRRAIIFGVGGVGSHLAYLLTRANTEWKQMNGFDESVDLNQIDELVLVDFDEVEKKNLKRQMFFDDFGGDEYSGAEDKKKCNKMMNLLVMNDDKNADGTMSIRAIDKKITDELDLGEFDRQNDFAFICTDNMQSKLLLFRYFEHKLMVSCDADYYEIKTRLDKGDNAVFEFGGENGAYNSAQTFSANIVSAMHMYRLFLRYRFNMPDMIIRERVDNRLECINKEVLWNPTKKEEKKKDESECKCDSDFEEENKGTLDWHEVMSDIVEDAMGEEVS